MALLRLADGLVLLQDDEERIKAIRQLVELDEDDCKRRPTLASRQV